MATYRGFSWYTAWLPSILATYTDVWVCAIIGIIRFISLINSSTLIAKQWLIKEFSIIAGGCMVIACLYLMSIESKKVKMTVITISCLIVCGCIIWTGVELTDISMMIAQVIYVLGHVVLVISTLIVLFRKTRRNGKNFIKGLLPKHFAKTWRSSFTVNQSVQVPSLFWKAQKLVSSFCLVQRSFLLSGLQFRWLLDRNVVEKMQKESS